MICVLRDGMRLFYEVEGDSGPAVLFLHGFAATSQLWRRQVKYFRADYRTICLDLRGHGQSDEAKNGVYSLSAFTDDIVAVLDDLRIENAIVIGHSMGGMVAQHFLLNYKERCRGLVLSSTTPNPPPREHFEPVIQWAMSLAEIPDELRAADPMMQNSQPISNATARGCGEMMITMPGFAGALRGNDTPALIIHGSDESDSILTGSRALAELLVGAREVLIDGAGHVAQITHAREYNQVLEAFFRNIG